MNQKEIGEIRRRIRRDRSNMTSIYGCYVNTQKEIISEFKQSVAMMPENEAEMYFGVMKKVLSGSVGKNLIDLSFKTSQVAGSPEHNLLMALRDTSLKNEELRKAFYEKVMETVHFEENYLILLGCESYDVPFKSSEEGDEGDSGEVYKYILCAVCPVKLSKANLHYAAEEKAFQIGGTAQVVAAPELGFLFPAFDDRRANIYNALFYTHSPKDNHEAFVSSVFNTPVPKPAYEQKKSFEALLTRTLGDECSLEVVQAVHEQLCQCIDLHKESRVPDTLLVNKEQVKVALATSGVSEKGLAKFSVDYDETFGFEAEIHPKNVIDNRKFEVKTPDVSITVNPERSDLIETRIIGGVKYLLICADENVEVNGVSICFPDEKN
ncbi:MAG: DUF4317 domain-containing protein [Oscillospiraceae bacterium]|nr:DUF4317 domain-containing protein [Oscillospiraceae bacterium]